MTTKKDTKPVVKVAESLVAAEVVINDPDVIERVTGPRGPEWRAGLYDLHTEEDVINHLAYNCLANGCENASMLDGWADLPAEAVEMRRVVSPYEYAPFGSRRFRPLMTTQPDSQGIPEQAVEAVARRIARRRLSQGARGEWSLSDVRHDCKRVALRDLEAAAPAIRAQERERIQEALEALPNHIVSPDTIAQVFHD